MRPEGAILRLPAEMPHVFLEMALEATLISHLAREPDPDDTRLAYIGKGPQAVQGQFDRRNLGTAGPQAVHYLRDLLVMRLPRGSAR